ncbi:hypothetical protein GKC29_11280 [Micromonospora sp. WMMC415]|uniref:hypothetical protein n=1 Tax=Micromonospora sp. WMMC415 TaxID=2675222 RepID=UPI0012B4CE5B|nr:hypothetical protein [Micromonospora sp. WMMC415]QGN47367.1 hypothetical protein GKC29_11280 [Micromonospora sp. WMMC415]
MDRLAVALALVRCAAALLPGPHRARHLEQWRADVQGAAELGLSPLRLAVGTTVAAARIAVVYRKESHAMQPIGPLALALRLVGGPGARRHAVTLAALFGVALLAGLGLLLTG